MTVSRAEYAHERVRCAEGSSIESPQVRAGQIPRETEGHLAPDQSCRLAVKRAFTRGHVVRLRFGLASACGSHLLARKREEGVIRESSDSIRVLVSCGWLQKSERSIFPARVKRTERWAEPRRGSLTRRLLPDEEGRFVAGERVRGERTQANSERAQTCFGCKAGDRTDGRRPGSESSRP